jgi:hypothetical protein
VSRNRRFDVRKLIYLAAILGLAYFGIGKFDSLRAPQSSGLVATEAIEAAYRNHATDVQVTGSGIVIRVLPDDNDGSRHQRFILRLKSGQTVLVAHNIDLAPRVADIANGDTVEFNGEYVWNPQGGLLHWTHHDPGGEHTGGWLKHNGHTYQ